MHINSKVQEALSLKCGDRNVNALDYQGIVDSIDYPCNPEIDEDLVKDTAETIRTHELFCPI